MEERKKTAREIIEGYQGPPVRIMEVCGTHTHEIFRLGSQICEDEKRIYCFILLAVV